MRGWELPVQFETDSFLLGGDVVLKADGIPILDWARKPVSREARVGERHEVKLTILRGGRLLEIPIAAVHRSGW